jgi:hypothetical protein
MDAFDRLFDVDQEPCFSQRVNGLPPSWVSNVKAD